MDLRTNEKRVLDCILTEDDVIRLTAEQDEKHKERSKMEFEVSCLKSKIKPLAERIEEIFRIRDAGKESRDVNCKWDYNWKKGEKYLIRLDTGEEIEQDIIQEWEKQAHLKL